MRKVVAALVVVGALASAAVAGSDTSPTVFHFGFHCRWIDYYDSVVYGAVLDPGMALIAAPGSRVDISVQMKKPVDAGVDRVLSAEMSPQFGKAGGYMTNSGGGITMFVPEVGGAFPMILKFRAHRLSRVDTFTLTILSPKAVSIRKGRINGYVVGHYPATSDSRTVPDRFIEVGPDEMDLHISRLFRVRDFVSNSRTAEQRRFYPKYAVIRYSLVRKIERIVTVINNSPNYQCAGIRVLSGYRTPDYNHALPEAAYNSYHQYGLAADIIVDSAPADGQFDDINKDRKIDIHDAANLAQICDALEVRGEIEPGGIGLYEYKHSLPGGKFYSTYHVHIDARPGNPKKARWGFGFKNGRKVTRLVWSKTR